MTTENETPEVATPFADQRPVVPPNATVSSTRRSSRLLDLALAAAAVVAIGGVAFAIGRGTAPAGAPPAFARDGQGPGGIVLRPDGSLKPGAEPGRGGLALAGGLSIDGTVTAVDADSLTLKLADGQEITFSIDDSTAYHEATDASASDVAIGDDVSVKVTGGGRGQTNGGSSEAPSMSATDVTVTP